MEDSEIVWETLGFVTCDSVLEKVWIIISHGLCEHYVPFSAILLQGGAASES
jgi:hypothetical protein